MKMKNIQNYSSLFLAVVLVLFVGACAQMPSQAMFRADAVNSGIYRSEGPKLLNTQKWQFKTGGPVVSSPAVADGTVYVGSEDGNLYAVDLKTGKEKWKFHTNGWIHSSPAVSGSLVFLTGYDYRFYALDSVTGKKLWDFSTSLWNHVEILLRWRNFLNSCRR
jgi:hypothetical protein